MKIRIKGYTFTLSEPFQAGTVINKAEAQALNSLRSENIQNNLRSMVEKAGAGLGPNELIPTETLVEIQAKLTEYDLAYQFAEKKQPRSRLGDIEEEARVIARERVQIELNRDELGGASWTEEQIEFQVNQYAELPAVIEEARQRVQARRSALSLSDL